MIIRFSNNVHQLPHLPLHMPPLSIYQSQLILIIMTDKSVNEYCDDIGSVVLWSVIDLDISSIIPCMTLILQG